MARAIDGHIMSAPPQSAVEIAAVRVSDHELHGGALDGGDRAHRLRAGGDTAGGAQNLHERLKSTCDAMAACCAVRWGAVILVAADLLGYYRAIEEVTV
jgi:hypothetical protein